MWNSRRRSQFKCGQQWDVRPAPRGYGSSPVPFRSRGEEGPPGTCHSVGLDTEFGHTRALTLSLCRSLSKSINNNMVHSIWRYVLLSMHFRVTHEESSVLLPCFATRKSFKKKKERKNVFRKRQTSEFYSKYILTSLVFLSFRYVLLRSQSDRSSFAPLNKRCLYKSL